MKDVINLQGAPSIDSWIEPSSAGTSGKPIDHLTIISGAAWMQDVLHLQQPCSKLLVAIKEYIAPEINEQLVEAWKSNDTKV
jgi:hypothetical protein